MIKEYAADLAAQMGMKLTRVSVVEGRKVGCLNMHLLNLVANGHLASTLVYQSELDELQTGTGCDRLETKLRAALSRLQILLEP